MSVSDDDWAWARQETEDAPPVAGFEYVTAILVAHNGAEWLPSTLRALAGLEQRPGRVIAIDAHSTDDSGRLLRQAFVDGVVTRRTLVRGVLDEVRPSDADGFALVVNEVVASLPPANGWVWLLHDDAAPGSNCLTEMLRVATAPTPYEGPAIVVPKLLRPKLRNRPDQVQSVGEAVSSSGARVTGAEVGDIDQQQDESARALGASTAGLLVRRDVWDALGGLSAELPGFRSGVDLGWRANEAGYTVRTAPDATLRHQQAGLIGLRESEQASEPEVQDLVAGLRVMVAHSDHPERAVWRARLMNRLVWFGAWLAKDAGQAHVRSETIKLFRTERAETAQLTADVQLTRRKPVRQALLPGLLWGVGHAFDTLTSRFGREDDSESEINIDTLTVDDDENITLPRPKGRNWLGLISAIALLIATLVACRSELGFGQLMSQGLAPAPGSLAATWHAWLVPSEPTGANAPWLGIMALGSTLFAGQPGVWAGVLILGGVFLAAWSAYRFVRSFVGSTPVCVGLAALWGLLLPVSGASANGSPGWVILAVGLPLVASAIIRWSNEHVTGLVGLRVPATAALAVVLVCSVTPVLWVATTVAAITVALRTHDWRGMLIVAIGPVAVLGPWIPRLIDEPGRLLTGVDPCLSRLIAAPNALGIILGQVGLKGAAPLWLSAVVFAIVWLLGLIGVASLPASRWRVWLLVGSAAAMVAGLVASRITVTIDGQEARAAILPWLMVAAIVAIGVTAAAWPKIGSPDFDAAPGKPHRKRRTIIAVILAIGIGLGAVWWFWAGEGQPLQRVSQPVPDYVAASEQSPRATRTLVVAVTKGQASVSLRDANSPTWGSGERSPIDLDQADRDAVVALAGQFADGFGTDDLAARLAAVGIGHVVVTGVSQTAIDAMSGVPDLAGGKVGRMTIWTVGGLPSRAVLLDGGDTSPVSDGQVPAGANGRVLALLEPTDMVWWATIDGVKLPVGDTPTHFEVPAAGGTLAWGQPVVLWAFWWHLLALLVLAWAALPASSLAERLARAEARRAVS